MNGLADKYASDVTGVLNGFDRLVFRGTLRELAVCDRFSRYLSRCKVLLKHFGAFAEKKTAELKRATVREAERSGRPVIYLPSPQISKEGRAREIQARDGVSQGLICVLHTVEPCVSYEIRKDRAAQLLVLRCTPRKCTHVYHYWVDPIFGFMGARIQTWFPFTVQVWLNGREWLARQMQRHGLGFERRDNCFVWLEDVSTAQKLMDEQLRTDWTRALDGVAARLNPDHEIMLAPFPPRYYWTAHQTEWASDVMFRSASRLATIYPALTRGAITLFGARDVMRFLGQSQHWNFQGEVVTSFKDRPEGVRVKHTVKHNSVKAYDKHGSVLRLETTVNDPTVFKVLRTTLTNPQGDKTWQPLRRGVSDLFLRAQVSQTINNRYAEALASIEVDDNLADLLAPVCKSRTHRGRRYRALRPFSADDLALLRALNHGDHTIRGFQNRDLRTSIYGDTSDPAEKRKLSRRISRLLSILRAHRLIRRLSRTHRYVLTTLGRSIVTAILSLQTYQVKTLLSNAA